MVRPPPNSSSLDSSNKLNGKDCLQQDDIDDITLMLKKQKLNVSAFQDVIASIPEMKAFLPSSITEGGHRERHKALGRNKRRG